ncbi:hypothetical protein [Aldersonia kunmingensis]|uniref:hypothetical protein n=1 Tax=Aldersonia kunmingensis TaxID=408066 RepID=UPI00082AFE41|nr:hypothetical protein [Aldersonia kunmingensis]
MAERTLVVADPGERENLLSFLTHAVRLDEAAVVRLRRRADGRVAAWVATGFDVLAQRAVEAELTPEDATVAAGELLATLSGHKGGEIALGFAMDSAWRGALPPERGFVHVDDVPARELVDLARRGTEVAQQHSSSQGPPASLLDQEVIEVSGNGETVKIPMRVVFALVGMGFVPHSGDDGAPTPELDLGRIDPHEIVRVRCERNWLRLDARYGSVSKRRTATTSLLIG